MASATKEYTKHPLAGDFPALEGEEFDRFADDIAARGLEEPITLHEGQILDGFNRYRACLARGVTPTFRKYTGDNPRAFVLSENLHRRHLTAETRRTFVAELRAQGKSTREIAETVGVSQSTVSRDIKDNSDGKVSPGEPNGSPETSQGAEKAQSTVTGRDGKTYRASQPKPLCDRCQRVGETKGCPACKDLRAKPKAQRKPRPRAVSQADELKDAFGNDIPKRRRDAYADRWIQDTVDTLAEISTRFRMNRFADGMNKRAKHYPFLNAKDFIDGCGFVIKYLDDLLNHLKDNRPAGVCPECGGEGCATCKMSGLVPRELYGKLAKKGAAK